MREIKFRGRKKDGSKWLYGNLYTSPSWKAIYDTEQSDCWDDFITVDPATVGQYTGLKDENGKDIYEGDILWWGKNDHAPSHLVFFADGSFLVSYPSSDTYEPIIDVLIGAEIIGNIHDNPELLEVEDENK